MTRTLDGAGLRVEIAVRKRPVVVRAAVLDRVDRAAAVEHADLEILPFDQLLGAGRELGYGADVDDLGHGVRKSDSSGRICPFIRVARGRLGAAISTLFSSCRPLTAEEALNRLRHPCRRLLIGGVVAEPAED